MENVKTLLVIVISDWIGTEEIMFRRFIFFFRDGGKGRSSYVGIKNKIAVFI